MKTIRVDGIPTDPPQAASAVEVEPGVWSVLIEGRSYEARVSGDEITVGSYRMKVQVDDPRKWNRSRGIPGSQGRISLVAPMPGKIVRLLVAQGDEVAAGQGIIVVEAMKMQNEMKAPRAGRVVLIDVAVGDTVNAGSRLAAIE